MTDSTDYRLYLEEKFAGIHKDNHARDINIHDKLDELILHVKKTNGNVTNLENQRDEYLKTRVDINMLKEVDKKVEDIKDDLAEYRFFKKYPKLTILIIAIFVVSSILAAIGTVETFKNNIMLKKQVTEQPIK